MSEFSADADEQCVNAWLSIHRSTSPSEALDSFEHAMRAIWSRASLTLGELTLSTVVAVVVRKVRSRHSCMGGLSVAAAGVRYERPSLDGGLTTSDLLEALRFTLIELLRTIGRFTAEILTPALHGELARLRRARTHALTSERWQA